MTRSAFAQRLRNWRTKRGLKQTELATLSRYSASTIRKLESGVLRPSHDIAERLAEVLELPEYDRSAFVHLARTSPPTPSQDTSARSSPSLDRWRPTEGAAHTGSLMPMLGRKDEQNHAQQLLSRSYVRLLTLTGPGGVGKTTLAHAIAEAVQAQFPDGVDVVSLASVRDPELVAHAIARAIGLQPFNARSPHDQLLALFKHQQRLLVLDTFEHLLAAAPYITRLLVDAPGLKVLVTSRVTLSIYVEHVLPVAPLTNPPLEHSPKLATLQAYPATALFLRHLQAIDPNAASTPDQNAGIIEVCRLLDGLPLAIEIAATRLQHFTLPQLLADIRLHLLSLRDEQDARPERHTTLAATIDWSYQLLNAAAKTLFNRAAVFVGGWTEDAAQAICGIDDADTAIINSLNTLLDHNLIVLQGTVDDNPRFTMLDTIHEYAMHRFVTLPEHDQVREQHLRFYTQFAEVAASHYRRADEKKWLDHLDLEHGNIRAAIQFARDSGATATAMHLIGLLGHFWARRGYWHEGARVVEAVLDEAHLTVCPERIQASVTALVLVGKQSDFTAMRRWAEDIRRMAQMLGDRRNEATALKFLGAIAHAIDHDDATAAHHFEAAVAACRADDDVAGLGSIRYQQWTIAAQSGAARRGSYWLEESMTLARQHGDNVCLAQALNDLGAERAEVEGRYAEARSMTEEGLALFRALGDVWGTCFALRNLGEILVAQRDFEAARQLYAESLALSERFQHVHGMATARYELGSLAWVVGDYPLAQNHLETSLQLAHDGDSPWGQGDALLGLGHVAYSRGDRIRACELYRESLRQFRRRQLVNQMRIAVIGIAWCHALDQPDWAARAWRSIEPMLDVPDTYMTWQTSDRVVVADIRTYFAVTLNDSVATIHQHDEARQLIDIVNEILGDEQHRLVNA